MSICKCGTCGYEWRHGTSGDHSCTDKLLARINALHIAAAMVINRHDSGELTNEPHDSESVETLRAMIPLHLIGAQ